MMYSTAHVLANLKLILNAENQSLHESKFVDESGSTMDDSSGFVSSLVGMYLIETEQSDGVYFLTELGYKFVEGNLHDEGGVDSMYGFQKDEDGSNQSKSKKRYTWFFVVLGLAVLGFIAASKIFSEPALEVVDGLRDASAEMSKKNSESTESAEESKSEQ